VMLPTESPLLHLLVNLNIMHLNNLSRCISNRWCAVIGVLALLLI
jgi:hypothetical protein